MPNLRTSLAAVLRRAGFIVDAMPTSTALLRLEDQPVDLLFLDLRSPYSSGLRLLSAIRLLFKEVPVIVLSSKISPRFRERVLRNGVAVYMLKPVDPAEVIQIAQQVAQTPNDPVRFPSGSRRPPHQTSFHFNDCPVY